MLMTVRDFLDEYPMARSTFYKLVQDGQIAITKIGRATRISRAHADAWAATLPVICGRGANDNHRD